MVDAHYDLLSICYVCYLKNDYTKIEKIANKIKNNNIKCIFASLYFMSEEEMKEELHENYYKPNISILTMFKISKQILENYLPDVDFVYTIEGCDYLDINELDDLYNEGLRSILPVWNNENRYGSGYRSDKGLTKEGIKLVNKAIDLGIGIDLSHSNPNTFEGIIEVIKENKRLNKDVICYASHSNSSKICLRKRNLTDKQLKKIREVEGLVGVFCNRNFVTDDYGRPKEEIEFDYLKHIIHIANIIGIESVMLSTDDMSFCGDIDPDYYDTVMFDYSNISNNIKRLLEPLKEDINKIMYQNAYNKIINKLLNKSNQKCK